MRNCTSMVRSALFFLIGGALAFAPAAEAAPLPSTDWRDYRYIAEDSIFVGPNRNIGGNILVQGANGLLDIDSGTFQLSQFPPPFVAARTLRIQRPATVANAYAVSYTHLTLPTNREV